MASQFARLFRDYYAIHETIHVILNEGDGAPLNVDQIARRVKEKHPNVEMRPAVLAEAIRQAAKDTRAPLSE
jgi:hypothetical protein